MKTTKQKKKRYWSNTRKFNGKTYHLDSIVKNKTKAKEKAKRQRKMGYKARIVSSKTNKILPKENKKWAPTHSRTGRKGKNAIYITRKRESYV